MTLPDGIIIEGEFKGSKLNGIVKITHPNGSIIEGEFKNNK